MLFSIVDIGTTFVDIINGIGDFITSVFDIFPPEINIALLSCFSILLVLYIYRLLR